MARALLLLAVVAAISLRLSESGGKVSCTDVGTCQACGAGESQLDYCRDTGKKIKQKCFEKGNTFDDFRACVSTPQDDQLKVIIFQVVVAVVGGLAYWHVQVKKAANLSLFEARKVRGGRK